MKTIILIAFLLVGCGAIDDTREANKQIIEANRKAVDACIQKDGIPIVNAYGRLEDCKFKCK